MPETIDKVLTGVTPKELDDMEPELRKFVDIERLQSFFADITPPAHTLFEEVTLEELAETLSSTIAEDYIPKLITFMGALLTYTEEEQTGILYQAGSSTGKSYIALEVLRGYFPNEDIIAKDYASPTAFFHKQTQLSLRVGHDRFYPVKSRVKYVSEQLEQWDKEHPEPEGRGHKTEHRNKRRTATATFREEWEELEKVWYWDLSRKIVLFKDMPHDDVLKNLRPLMSKDERIFEADITDKSTSGQHATKNIILRGYPTFLFCSASYSQDEQERTRFFLLSPEVEEEKVSQGVRMALERACNRPRYENTLERDKARTRLRERNKAIRAAKIRDVIIPDRLMESIEREVFSTHERLQPRLMRDVPRMIALMKAHALLNFSQREQQDGIITATEADVQAGLALYAPIAEANEMGVPPQIFEFFEETLEPAIRATVEEDTTGGITRKEFTRLWFDRYHEQIGYNRLRTILHLMENAGLICEETDPVNRARNLINVCGGEVSLAKKEREDPEEPADNDMPSSPFRQFLQWLTTHGLDMRGKTIRRQEIHAVCHAPAEQIDKWIIRALEENYLRETEPGVYCWDARATREGIVS